jgi:hypothetical protein
MDKANKKYIYDAELSLQAKGMMTVLMEFDSLIDIMTQLKKFSDSGKDRIYSCLNELMNAGYLTRQIIRGPRGRTKGIEYKVHPEGKSNE